MDMNFRKERVNKICEDLSSYITVQSSSLNEWQYKKGTFYTPQQADAEGGEWQPFDCNHDFWPGPDMHYWFRTTVTVPKEFDKKPLWLSIATQVNFWDAVNPQFLLFIDGKVTQGVDINHREIKLFSKAKAGDCFVVDLQAYTGRDNDQNQGTTGNLRLFGSLLEISEEINDVYYNLAVPNEIAGRLDENDLHRAKLQNALEEAVNLLDLRVPYSADFYRSVEECNRFVKKAIYKDLAGNDEVIATCIGHTHIDIAWWWTVAQTREKAARSFATVLKLMEEYPNYKFMSSQPQLYQFVKERYPELYERIKARIKEGRWEPEGGMWVECDCNVTSGESLVRQFLHGKKFFKQEFNKENKILWLPDVFGYSAALPQIMRKSGIDYFMTTKIAWNQYDKLPVDTFWWKGIDGSEVFTHLITTQDAHQPEDSHYTTYNGMLYPISVMRAWQRYQHKDLNNDVLISYGFGDGGGGPTRKMLENSTRLDKGIVGAPKVRMETARTYFDQLYARVGSNPKLQRWAGELYLEYHRGTYTSMARNKRGNRKNELLWQDVEFFSTWAEKLGLEYPTEEIYKSWETILLNQFHDILPGSSIHEVYEVTKEEYADLEQRGTALVKKATQKIADSIGAEKEDVVVFNSLSFDRDDLVTVSAESYADVQAFEDIEGNLLPVQKTADGQILFAAKKVSAKGVAVFHPSKATARPQTPFTITGSGIETPFYKISFDKGYQWTSLFDKCNEREVLKAGQKGNVLMVYEDKPIYYDNWDIDIYYKQKSWAIDSAVSAEWIEKGPIRATLLVVRKFLDSTIKQKIHFYADDRRIDFETYVDWKQFNLLLKTEFPVDVNANEATYDIQFGNITRPTHQNTSWDKAKFEVCGHKWADLSEGGYGMAILNDCKYGHGITEGKITLTLLKSGILPNPVTDQEEHFFTYAILPHGKTWKEAGVVEQAYRLNVPVYTAIAQQTQEDWHELQYMSIDRSNVIIETVKKAEDGSGTIVRMYECKNMRTQATLKWSGPVLEAYECDLMENNLTKFQTAGDMVQFQIKPYEIKTFKIVD